MARVAEVDLRLPENVEGPYFVDSSCIDCDTCRCIGPDFFSRSDEGGYSYVSMQPKNEDDDEIVEEAMDCCPAGAIGRIDLAS